MNWISSQGRKQGQKEEHEAKNKGKCESDWHVHIPNNDAMNIKSKGHGLSNKGDN